MPTDPAMYDGDADERDEERGERQHGGGRVQRVHQHLAPQRPEREGHGDADERDIRIRATGDRTYRSGISRRAMGHRVTT